MTLDHIGIVVPSLETAIDQWKAMFEYHRNSDIVLNTRQKVRVVFLSKHNSTTIKLIEPSAPDSPVFQNARRGGGLHHLCFKCSHLESGIAALRSQGALLVVPPEPGEAFNNHEIAFLVAGNINIELIATEGKRGWGLKPCSSINLVS